MRLFLFAITVSLGLITTAMAETPIITAPDAEARLAADDLVLLDIRTPQEWKDTGVAAGAWPVSMHDAEFGARLQAILQNVPPERIALICATGGRTSYVAQILQRNGITGVADVSEGMMGNGSAPGWIARGMPVVSAEEATKAYESATADW